MDFFMLVLFLLLLPLVLFMGYTSQWLKLKEKKKGKRSIIIKLVIQSVVIILSIFLFFYLPEKYSKYIIFSLLIMSFITTYLERK
jgi:UDP-N-acetylmuramyl pentapeptide phosphotransferase/UDP-N-acetylglucosamine-1-phosphate transferase